MSNYIEVCIFFSVFQGMNENLQQVPLKNPSLATLKGPGTGNKTMKRFK